MKHSQLITSVLRPLADLPNQAYLSDVLQVADILQWILDQTGPAAVQMTSFSIAEEFLRRSSSSRRRSSSPRSTSFSISRPPTRLSSCGLS